MTRVKDKSFSRPLWSPDGLRIAFLDSAGQIWIMGSEGEKPRPITDKEDGRANLISCSPDGENIYYSRTENQKNVNFSILFLGGEPRKMEIEHLSDFSPDGKRIVYDKEMKQIREFWLLENFLPEKKKN